MESGLEDMSSNPALIHVMSRPLESPVGRVSHGSFPIYTKAVMVGMPVEVD